MYARLPGWSSVRPRTGSEGPSCTRVRGRTHAYIHPDGFARRDDARLLVLGGTQGASDVTDPLTAQSVLPRLERLGERCLRPGFLPAEEVSAYLEEPDPVTPYDEVSRRFLRRESPVTSGVSRMIFSTMWSMRSVSSSAVPPGVT